MTSQEILTLQLGEYSNFVGAHCWNLRDSSTNGIENDSSDLFDKNVFFRRGISRTGNVTWSPRVIAIDLKAAIDFTSLEQEFSLGELQQGMSTQHSTNQEEKKYDETKDSSNGVAPFLSKDDDHWRETLNEKLNSHSLHLLSDFQHENPLESFNQFNYGVKYMEKDENMEIIENSIRYFTEECDYFQGFHILLDADNGFGGIASRLLQLINEEYSRKATFAVPVFPPSTSQKNRAERLTNIGLSIETLFEGSSMLAPASVDSEWCSMTSRTFTQLAYQPYSLSQSGAVLATALETVTLPLWSKTRFQTSLASFSSRLSAYNGRKAVGLTCAIPFPSTVTDLDSLRTGYSNVVSLTPGTSDHTKCLAQSLVWRGISNQSKFERLLDHWSNTKWNANTLTMNSLFATTCSITKIHPDFLIRELYSHEPSNISSFSTYGGVHNSVAIGQSLKKLHEAVSKINVKKLQHTLASGLEEDDLLENRDKLSGYAELYEEFD